MVPVLSGPLFWAWVTSITPESVPELPPVMVNQGSFETAVQSIVPGPVLSI